MEEELEVHIITIEEQFHEFSRCIDQTRDGTTITLFCSDYWLRQAKIIDDRRITMTDTGIAWWNFCKTELNVQEWCEFLGEICDTKRLDRQDTESKLCNCGAPGQVPVHVPQYRLFFDTYVPKNKLINTEDKD